jgi:6-pyruvoyl-tetrahydropterin synthase
MPAIATCSAPCQMRRGMATTINARLPYGRIDETGMIVDLALLDRILQDEVLDPFAGKHFNLDVPAFAYGNTLPTCEAIAAYVFFRIAPRLPAGLSLERVRIMEDPTLYGDCTGIE